MKNVLKYGCKIIKIYKILNYSKKGIIFDKIITDLYNKRLSSDNEIDKMLYKRMMNSLYGIFAVKENKKITKFIPFDESNFLNNLELYADNIDDIGSRELGNDTNIISYELNENLFSVVNTELSDNLKNKIHKEFLKKSILKKHSVRCVHISAAISAYARCKLYNDMVNHINNNNAIVYYYDTDSIFSNKKLNENLVSLNELGKYKLEKITTQALFIAPKIYYLANNIKNIEIKKFKSIINNKEISYNLYYSFLKKATTFTNINEIPIKKNFKQLKLLKTVIRQQISFNTKKYIKIYDDNDIFIKTKPVHIEKSY